MPDNFRRKTLRLKQGDIRVTTSGDNCDMHMLTNIRYPPAEGNFCDESGNALPQPLWRITVNTWVMSIKVTEWPTATVSVNIH
jgi:hypothetical protein